MSLHFNEETCCAWPNPAIAAATKAAKQRPLAFLLGPRRSGPVPKVLAAMVNRFGSGRIDRRCRDCSHLYVARTRPKGRGFSTRLNVYRCRVQQSEAPDLAGNREPVFQLRWPACARFEERAS